MKYLGLILATLALVAGQILAYGINENDSQLQQIKNMRGMDDKLRTFLENFKTTLREGNETLGIPVMDPYYNESVSYDIDDMNITGHLLLQELNVLGISNYNVEKAEISIFSRKITAGFTWPKIFIETMYNLNSTLMATMPIYGSGNFTTVLSNLFFETTMKFSVIGGVKVQEVSSQVKLGNLKVEITGLWDDQSMSDVVSHVTSNVGPQLVQDFQPEITEILNEKILTIANEKLDGISLSEIVGIFGRAN